ncbi:MAG TPA: hypothetical protein VJ965_05890, partial [Anaerolineales bacterium]|nr:hypothetical protein [Anaerolineales bacterium]
MKLWQRVLISTILAVATIVLLFILYPDGFDTFRSIHFILFTVLLTYTAVFGIPLGGAKVALVPLAALSSLIVMGPFASSLAIIISDILYAVVRHYFGEKVGWYGRQTGFSLATATGANITMHVLSLIAAGAVYNALDTRVPIENAQQ